MKFVEPLIKKFKEVISEVFYRYYQALDGYHRLNVTNGNLYRENEKLTKANDKLAHEMKICVQKIGITNCYEWYSATNKLTICLNEQGRKNSLNSVAHALEMIKTKGRNTQ